MAMIAIAVGAFLLLALSVGSCLWFRAR